MRGIGRIGWVAVTTACIGTGNTGAGNTPTSSRAPSVQVPSANSQSGRWSFAYLPDSVAYRVSRTVVITSGSNPVRTDSSGSYAYETIVLRALPDSAFDVRIRADTLTTARSSTSSGSFVDSLIVHARLKAQGFTELALDSQSTCNTIQSTVSADLTNLLPAMPPFLTTGLTWNDSVQINECQNNVPVAVDILRTFRVVGPLDPRDAGTATGLILVERVDSISGKGSGVIEQHQLSLQAAGHGHADIYIDTERNKILRIETTSTLTLIITSAEGSANFQQLLNQRFKLVP